MIRGLGCHSVNDALTTNGYSSPSLDDQGTSSAAEIWTQAHFWLEIRFAFRLTPHWKRLTLA
jgi:hypothetical protein